MQKSCFYLMIVFFAFIGSAQEFLPQTYDTIVHKHDMSIRGMGFYQTSHLRNELTNLFLSGGLITDKIKSNSRLSENQNGRLGGELFAELMYKCSAPLFKKRQHIGWLVKVGSSNSFGVQYTADAYDLMFYGNEPMLGDEAVISNTSAFNMSFHKAGFGLYNTTNKNSITLNLIVGNSYSNFYIDRGNLAFTEDGGEVTVTTDITVQRANSPAFFQGLGASIDFELHAVIKDVPGISGFFQVSGKNLGVMFAPQLEQIQLNANTTYSGLSFNQLSDLINYDEQGYEDFFDSLGFSRSSASGLILLPGGSIQAGKIVEDNSDKKFQSFFGIRVLTNLVHKPMIYGGGHYSFNDWISMGAQLTFGGYGGFRGGLYAHAKLNKWSLGIATEDAPGFIAKSTFGKSVLMRVSWKI
jgi:hypothetical protein